MNRLPLGTLINMSTVTVGSLIGMALNQAFPPEMETIIFQAIGLAVLIIGIQMALKIPEAYLLIFVFSLIVGGLLGEWLGMDDFLRKTGDQIKALFQITEGQFTEGMVTAFLLFCVGSMTIVGAIEEGLHGKRELLLIKSTLDGITSIALAASFGIGVWFSIFPMLLLQGGITVLARQSKDFFTSTILAQLTAVGGVLIVGVSINMLRIGEINVENLLPSLVIVVLLSWIYDRNRLPTSDQ